MPTSMLISMLENTIEYNQKKCTELSNGLLSADPSWGLINCDQVFESAARVKVSRDIIQSLLGAEEKGTPEVERVTFLIDYFRHEVMNGAKWPLKSTSVTSNLMHQYFTAAKVEAVEMLEGYLKTIAPKSMSKDEMLEICKEAVTALDEGPGQGDILETIAGMRGVVAALEGE